MSPTPEAVHPLWLVKALAAVLLAAVLCGYLTLCLLFYQGQWQLVLHPSRDTSIHPPVVDSPTKAELVRFAPDESATLGDPPRLAVGPHVLRSETATLAAAAALAGHREPVREI